MFGNTVPEEANFGMVNWRLLSREVDENDKLVQAVYVMAVQGLGVYMRTVLPAADGSQRWEEPILIKNALLIELYGRVGEAPTILDKHSQPLGGDTAKYQCLSRDLATVEHAKKQFMPKGRPPVPGFDAFPGAILTQERRQMPMAPPIDLDPEKTAKIMANAAQEAGQ